MHVRLTLVAVLAAAAAVAGSASAAGPPGTKCGTVVSAGRSWVVVTHRVDCGAAKKLIRTLAARPIPHGPARLYGSFLGMRCVHMPPAIPFIVCAGGNTGVQAVARP